jgi:hypothetical protein
VQEVETVTIGERHQRRFLGHGEFRAKRVQEADKRQSRGNQKNF